MSATFVLSLVVRSRRVLAVLGFCALALSVQSASAILLMKENFNDLALGGADGGTWTTNDASTAFELYNVAGNGFNARGMSTTVQNTNRTLLGGMEVLNTSLNVTNTVSFVVPQFNAAQQGLLTYVAGQRLSGGNGGLTRSLEIINVTDNRIIQAASTIPKFANSAFRQNAAVFNLLPSDVGDTLQFRFAESGGNADRGLQLSDLEFNILENVARRSTSVASQSTTDSGGLATRAIDGNTDGSFSSGSTTHTGAGLADGTNVFWQVDLAKDFALEEILLYNRTDCCGNRLSNFRVSVLNDNVEVFGQDYNVGSGNADDILHVLLPSTVLGDLVRVSLLQGHNNTVDAGRSVLSLAEVQVFGSEILPEPSSLALVSLMLGLVAYRRRRRVVG